jgi:hypothetical protein
MKKLIVLFCVLLSKQVIAQEQSQPLEIANTVSNLWVNNNFSNMTVYVNGLYIGYKTNYLPIVLVSAFHDSVFLGNLLSASNKLERVNQFVLTSPQSFTDEFKVYLRELIGEVKMEIDLYVKSGRTPEDVQGQASPQTVRSISQDILLPDISILYYTPAITLP